MSTVIRPDILRRLCKEPLAFVHSVQLRGRGITRLVGLNACPALTSLDISHNKIQELDSTHLEACKELWVIDASHNRLESLGGLSSFMALGYLNLSSNSLALECLRPLARAHILELFLGNDRPEKERRRTLALLPNVWVVDDEFVTARERRVAEDDFCDGGGHRDAHLLQTWNNSSLMNFKSQRQWNDGRTSNSGGQPCVRSNGVAIHTKARNNHHQEHTSEAFGCGSGFAGLETQGRRVREFYENVVWKLPSRTGSAETFRLSTLLSHYNKRASAANASAWLGSFTCRGVYGGARGCVRRDWSVPLPRPHLEALTSLSLELKLDVVVLLAVRAAMRDNIPRQVLADAFMVLLLPLEGLPAGIHNDLSRVPAFICTALVHVLRASIFTQLDQNSMPGNTDTTAPPLLDRQQGHLLETLPPVVTGVDVDHVFESWHMSSLGSRSRTRPSDEGDPTGRLCSKGRGKARTANEPLENDDDTMSRVGHSLESRAAAEAALLETHVPSVSNQHDGRTLNHSSGHVLPSPDEESAVMERTSTSDSTTGNGRAGAGLHEGETTQADEQEAAPKVSEVEGNAAEVIEEVQNRSYFEANTSPPGVGLTRLCQRAVILLTRSPACPDLVAWQTHPTEQRTYKQMEPLLARANMTHKDLHPGLAESSGSPQCLTRTGKLKPGSLLYPHQYSPSPPLLAFDAVPAAGEVGGRSGVVDGFQRQGPTRDHKTPTYAAQRPGAEFRPPNTRQPKDGESVQVLYGVWSVIVEVYPEPFLVVLAPFEGLEASPYHGDPRVDSRDLCYDPRGWWRHAPALIAPALTGVARLHRPARGYSAAGLPWGAGSLNEALEGCELDNELSLDPGQLSSAGGIRQATRDSINQRCAESRVDPCKISALATESRSSTKSLAASRPPEMETLGHSSVSTDFLGDRRPDSNTVCVFSADGSWDPVFVMAPPRLVGSQNRTAVRKRGRRKAWQAAWRRIDAPEAILAPRPMMPRCCSLPAPANARVKCRPLLRQASLIPSASGLSDEGEPRGLATVAPSHGGTQSRSSSVPSINTPRSCLAAARNAADSSADCAWLELQREMGSLRADNQMLPRDSGRGGGPESDAHRQRPQGSTPSVLTTSLPENSTLYPEVVSGLVAKTPTLELDSPTPAWKEERSEDKPITVFELTQVGGGPETNGGKITAVDNSAPLREEKAITEMPGVDKTPENAVSPKETTQGQRRKGGGIPGDNIELPRRRSRTTVREGDYAAATATSRKWKPNVKRSLEWFPVRGRQVFLVDPGDVNFAAVAVNKAAEAGVLSATVARAWNSHLPHGCDFRTEGRGAGGADQSLDRGYTGFPRRKPWEGTHDKEAGADGEAAKRPGSGDPRHLEQRSERSGHQEKTNLQTVGFPSAARLVDMLRSPPIENRDATARQRSCRRPRPRSGAGGTRGSHDSGGLVLMGSSSTYQRSETKHGEKPLGESTRCNNAFGTSATPEGGRLACLSPNALRGGRDVDARGWSVEDDLHRATRQVRDAAASTADLSASGQGRVHRLSHRRVGKGRRPTDVEQKGTNELGLMLGRMHGAGRGQQQQIFVRSGQGVESIGTANASNSSRCSQGRGTTTCPVGRAHVREGANMRRTTSPSCNTSGDSVSVSSICRWDTTGASSKS